MEPGPLELAILVGLQASGKSTFYRARLGATHALVSRDLFRSNPDPRRRQRQLVEAAISGGRSVALDNTNPTRAERREIIELARAHGARVVVYWFLPDLKQSLARNARREGKARVPVAGILATRKRLEAPSFEEGLDRLFEVRSLPEGRFEVTERERSAEGPAPPARREPPAEGE